MPEKESVTGERRFGLGTPESRTQCCGQRVAIDLDSAQPREVEADQPPAPTAQRLDSADDAGATTEGDDRNALRGAGVQDPRQAPGSLTKTTASGAPQG